MGRECGCGRRAVPEDSRKGEPHPRADRDAPRQGRASAAPSLSVASASWRPGSAAPSSIVNDAAEVAR